MLGSGAQSVSHASPFHVSNKFCRLFISPPPAVVNWSYLLLRVRLLPYMMSFPNSFAILIAFPLFLFCTRIRGIKTREFLLLPERPRLSLAVGSTSGMLLHADYAGY